MKIHLKNFKIPLLVAIAVVTIHTIAHGMMLTIPQVGILVFISTFVGTYLARGGMK